MADIAELGVSVDTSGARNAAKDLLNFNKAAIAAAGSVDKLEASQSKLSRNDKGQFIGRAEVVEKYGNEVERLAGRYNQALAAQLAFDREVGELNRAVELGIPIVGGYDAALERLSAQAQASAAGMQAASVSAGRMGAQMNSSSMHTANLFAQLNDIGVMMAYQNPFQLALQQGTQINQVWASMGAQGRSLRGVMGALGSAFTTMLAPMNLLTIGLIAGAGYFVQWAISGKDAADANQVFEESLQGVTSSANNLASAYRDANLSSRELVEQFGTQARHLQSLYDLNVRMQSISLGQSIRDSAAAASDIYAGLAEQMRDVERVQVQIGRSSRDQSLAQALLNQEMEEFQEATGMSYRTALDLQGVLQSMQKAKTLEQQAAAAERFAEWLDEAYKSGADIPPEIIKIGTEAGLSAIAIRQMQSAAEGTEGAMWRVAAAATAVRSILASTYETGTFIDSYVEPGSPLGDRPPTRPTDIDFGLPVIDTGTGGGGGGGGASAADQIQEDFKNRWQALQEGFKGEFDLSLVEYQKQLETLDWALSQKLIKEQEFQRNKQLLYTMTFGTEAQQNLLQYQLDQEALQLALDQKLITHQTYLERLKAMQFEYQSQAHMTDQNMLATNLGRTSQYFGQLVSLTGNSYDTLAKLQQSFAAGQALVNAYLAASQTLADPTLGFWGKMAAYGKVLAAGLGLVSAIKGAGGGSSGGSGGAAGGQAATAAQQEPNREVLVRLEGDEFYVGLAAHVMDQIYEQTKDGRVVVARDF